MTEIKILKEDDVLHCQYEIMSLLNECVLATYTENVENDFTTGKLMSLKENLARGKAYAFIALDENNILGFLWSYPVQTPVGQRLHVAYFSVKPKERGKGIGQLLLKEAEKQAEKIGIKEVELIVSNKNIRAKHFYRKFGYGTEKLILKKEI